MYLTFLFANMPAQSRQARANKKITAKRHYLHYKQMVFLSESMVTWLLLMTMLGKK